MFFGNYFWEMILENALKIFWTNNRIYSRNKNGYAWISMKSSMNVASTSEVYNSMLIMGLNHGSLTTWWLSNYTHLNMLITSIKQTCYLFNKEGAKTSKRCKE